MLFLAVGIEYKTAPLPIRERVALEGEALSQAGARLIASPSIKEVAILSTCNRTEFYLFADDMEEAFDSALAILTGGDEELGQYVQVWRDRAAAERLFRISAGLESQVLGEPQILSQVRAALETAQRDTTIGPNLHALFRSVIRCARRARANTALGQLNPSLAGEAVRTAEMALGTLRDRTVLLVGAGRISRLVGEELRKRRPKALYVANRTASAAAEMAQELGGAPVPLTDIPRLLLEMDVVICTTSARQYVLTRPDFPPHRQTPMHVFDLAIPRDVDPVVGTIPGVSLHDLDSLLPTEAIARWEQDVRRIEGMIAGDLQGFMAWHLTRRVVPVIANLRSHVERVSEQELQRVAPQLTRLTDREHAAVESLTQRLIDKMFHHLVMRLRLAAQTDSKLVEAAEFFFLHGEGSLFPHATETTEDVALLPSAAQATENPTRLPESAEAAEDPTPKLR